MTESIFYNGAVFTADINNTIVEAIAINQGKIVAVGKTEEIMSLVTVDTKCIDLEGKMLMPGLIDAHMHPMWGGQQLVNCSLRYESLTLEETLQRIQQGLDKNATNDANEWFQVRAWSRSAMLPVGADLTRNGLDQLNTNRPIVVFANDCHTLVANSRALELLGLNDDTPDPADGKIGRDEQGRLNGILEDAPAMRAYDSLPSRGHDHNLHVATLVQEALNQQGVTTVFDARVSAESLELFTELKATDALSIRYLAAKEIMPSDAPTLNDVKTAVANVKEFSKAYVKQVVDHQPDVAVTSVKFFVDGVLHPMMTAALLSPYLHNMGTDDNPDWQSSGSIGDFYFSEEILTALTVEAAKEGFDLHYHTVAEGAIEYTLNAIEAMRMALPNKDIRPALAHNELAAPHHYSRFASLNAIAVLSLQWAGLLQSVVEEMQDSIGQERAKELEPAAKFIDAGARVAYGSDWPIDHLNEWYNLKVGLTRQGHDTTFRLDTDRDLTMIEVLRAATIEAAYLVHMDQYIGSLEAGKFADFIILDRNLFTIEKHLIEQTEVLSTVVAGKEVYCNW